MTKVCSGCKENKSIDEFYIRDTERGTRRADCKECVKAKRRLWNFGHRVDLSVRNRLYRSMHKEEMATADHKRYWSNPEKARSDAIDRYNKNIDRSKSVQKKYRQENPEVFRERNRRRRAKLAGLSGHFTEQEWQELLEAYGSVCMNPECLSTENLTRDHIIPLSKGGSDTIDNIQILCSLCNSIKHTTLVDYKILLCNDLRVNI